MLSRTGRKGRTQWRIQIAFAQRNQYCTKNLNWEILTKNLLTFKRWDGIKDKIFLEGGSLKNFDSFGGECFVENQYIGGTA